MYTFIFTMKDGNSYVVKAYGMSFGCDDPDYEGKKKVHAIEFILPTKTTAEAAQYVTEHANDVASVQI